MRASVTPVLFLKARIYHPHLFQGEIFQGGIGTCPTATIGFAGAFLAAGPEALEGRVPQASTPKEEKIFDALWTQARIGRFADLLEQCLHRFDTFGMFRREVVLLANIFPKVVEFHR